MSDYVKPLSYVPLKAVLELLDPSVRYQLNQRIPSIRITDSLVPLNFRHLSFGKLSMTLNDTEYKLGVYRHYSAGQEVPQDHQNENNEGGVGYDMNGVGLNDTTSYVKTPGDIGYGQGVVMLQLRLDGTRPEPGVPYEMLRRYEENQRVWKSTSEEYETAERADPAWISTLRSRALLIIIERSKQDAENCKAEILEIICGPGVTELPFKPYLQLTITKAGIVQKVERVEYNPRLYGGFKYLATKLFNYLMRNGEAIPVKTLGFTENFCIIPLPVGLKFNVDEIQSTWPVQHTIDHVREILDVGSRVLEN